MEKKATNKNKSTIPKTTKYYFKWQIDEYKSVKKSKGKQYADKWFEAKYGR